MEEFNNVPSTGKYGDSISIINQNFQMTHQAMQMLKSLVSANPKYVTVEATSQTTDVHSVLPATGAKDTIYRVGKWDGAQYNVTCYTEYGWNGTDYVALAVKEYTLATSSDFNNPTPAQKAKVATVGSILDGADSEPIEGSEKLLKSGGMQHWLNNEQNIIRPTIPYAYMGSSTDNTNIYSNNFDNIIKAYGIEIYAPAGDIGIYKVNVKSESSSLIKTVTIPHLGTHTFMFDAPVELSSNEFIGTKGVLKFINSSTLPSDYYRKGRGGYGNYGYLPNLQVSFSILINNVDNELGAKSEIDKINAELNSTLLYKPTPIDALNVTDSAHLYGNRYGMLSKVYGITIVSSGTVEIYKLNFVTKEYELIDTHISSGNYVKDTHLFSAPVILGETEIIATKGSVKYSNTATPHVYPKIPCGIETEVSGLPNFQLAVEILTTVRDTFNAISDKCAQFAAKNKNFDDLIFDYSVDAVNDIICIGDSMTEGVIVDYENLHVAAATYLTYSYPAVLGHLTGWNIENAGYHDIDALNWWTHIFNRYEYSNYKVALIELGQNNGLTDTLVQDTTISEGQTYLDYANTNTGSYCKIIEGLKAANSRMLIVVVISPRIDATTRSVILQIIAKYNLPFIDLKDHSMINLEDNKYHGKNYLGGIDYVHYSRSGYVAKAILIKNRLGTIVNNNTNIMNTYPDSPSQNPTDWHS